MANHNEYIPALERAVADSMQLRFSFKHLDFTNPKFNPSTICTEYFVRLFQILHRFSNWTVVDFIDQNNAEHRHIIDFAQTTELDGFQHIGGIDSEQLGSHEGWQFGVYPELVWNRWRAHGILVDDTLYVVWLDQEHLLFP
jgi:hypothetical protein